MNVKGSALRARAEYVRGKGEGAWDRFLDALSEPTRKIVQGGLLASAWYPYEAFIDICETIDRTWGKGDLELCFELGQYACDANLTTLYRVFFRIGNLQFIIRRAAAAWKVNYDEGSMYVVEETKKHVTLQIDGVPLPHRAHCLSVKGWISRAVELTGERVLYGRMSESCRATGDEKCRMSFYWE